jgi:hypothetical protein
LAFPFVFCVMVLAINFDWKNPLSLFFCIVFDLFNFRILNTITFAGCPSLLDLFNIYNLQFNCCTLLDFEHHQHSNVFKYFQVCLHICCLMHNVGLCLPSIIIHCLLAIQLSF